MELEEEVEKRGVMEEEEGRNRGRRMNRGEAGEDKGGVELGEEEED